MAEIKQALDKAANPDALVSNEQLKDVTSACERGNGLPLKALLDDIDSYTDRLKVLRTVDKLNEDNRKENKFLPDLQVRAYPTKYFMSDTEYMYMGVYHDPSGWWNTSRIYGERNNFPDLVRSKAFAYKR